MLESCDNFFLVRPHSDQSASQMNVFLIPFTLFISAASIFILIICLSLFLTIPKPAGTQTGAGSVCGGDAGDSQMG